MTVLCHCKKQKSVLENRRIRSRPLTSLLSQNQISVVTSHRRECKPFSQVLSYFEVDPEHFQENWLKWCLSWRLVSNILIKLKKVIRYWPSRELTFPAQSPAVHQRVREQRHIYQPSSILKASRDHVSVVQATFLCLNIHTFLFLLLFALSLLLFYSTSFNKAQFTGLRLKTLILKKLSTGRCAQTVPSLLLGNKS